MKFTNVRIKNYKALRDVSLPLSGFVCLTGENNAGKSSALQALSLFISPSKLEGHHFFNPEEHIEITATMGEISAADLGRFNEEPRKRIQELIKDGALVLTRRFSSDGDTQLGCYTLLPKDARFDKEAVDALLKGKTKGDIRTALLSAFPDKGEEMPTSFSSQKQAKDLIANWGNALPEAEKEMKFRSLPTGADFSIAPLLPDDIYIPAVKDLKDDVSMKQGSSFGKVLGILMEKIEEKLAEEAGLFEKLQKKLSRIHGSPEDGRLPEIRDIESMLQGFVRDSFASVNVEIDIPPPEIKTILSTAKIFVDDGVRGPIEFKGDGLRRAVVFAVLRTYVALVARNQAEVTAGSATSTSRGYILLFEEPEIFLHPDAQRLLFEALRVFSENHQVFVTTHSPLFLAPGTATFVRMAKMREASTPKPFTRATPVVLTTFDAKDEFQLICFENNNAALFAKSIVLVEGDSEAIVFPHIAVTLNPDWSCAKKSVAFVQAKGKGSIKRYRNFFRRFGISAKIIVDLDVLVSGFEKLDPTDAQNAMRAELIALVDAQIPSPLAEPNAEELKKAYSKADLKALWKRAREAKQAFDVDTSKASDLVSAVDAFFAWERKDERLTIMQNPPTAAIQASLTNLLASLRGSNVFVLSKGAIEDYYPPGNVITGQDKPSKAQSYRNVVTTAANVVANCPVIACGGGVSKPELEMFCAAAFDQT